MVFGALSKYTVENDAEVDADLPAAEGIKLRDAENKSAFVQSVLVLGRTNGMPLVLVGRAKSGNSQGGWAVGVATHIAKRFPSVFVRREKSGNSHGGCLTVFEKHFASQVFMGHLVCVVY